MWAYGNVPTGWKICKVKDYSTVVTDYVANGSFASLAKNVNYKDTEDEAVLIRLTDFNNGFNGNFVYIDNHAYEFLSKSKLFGGEIIISNVGANVGTVFKCTYLDKKMSLAPNSIMLKTLGNDDFYYYWFSSRNGQHSLKSIVTGSAQPKFNKTNFRDLEIPVPPIETQNRIVSILKSIDSKIELNNKINNNLEQQAFCLFNEMFPAIRDGSNTIGDYITPKRGKNLLTKNAIPGEIPVVAGGLEPSTYHNQSNTKAPALTISASGANAGYINLWHTDVWSSDSSYIDTSMTPDVYFWYAMLKLRQKEIFDSQTGSAQAHIYPQHIAVMSCNSIDTEKIKQYTVLVSPLFKMIGENKIENNKLSALRDSLLPKLMSGELDVSELDI